MNFSNRNPEKGLIVHSDRGSQYSSDIYKEELKKNECIQSMSRKGNCWDNACVESFFHLLKVEALNDLKFSNIEEVQYEVFKYIEHFYNRKRIHSSLNYKTPMEFEKDISA